MSKINSPQWFKENNAYSRPSNFLRLNGIKISRELAKRLDRRFINKLTARDIFMFPLYAERGIVFYQFSKRCMNCLKIIEKASKDLEKKNGEDSHGD